MPDKPTASLDSNFISLFCYDGPIVDSLAYRNASRDWWGTERQHFQVWASVAVEAELSRGVYRGQAHAVAMVRRLPYLPRIEAVDTTARLYWQARLVPENKFGDALQLAFATVHRMDYLLTWNYAHLANVETQRKLGEINQRLGMRTPLLVTPHSIPRVAWGQDIRRRDD